MSNQLTINRDRTSIIIMHYQHDIFEGYQEEVQKGLITRAGIVLAEARDLAMLIVHIVARFREGFPEVSLHNQFLRDLKERPRLQEGTPGAEIFSGVAPKPGEVVIASRRVGAFLGTDLAIILRANNIDALVLMGVSTSGCLLSTVRYAADMDYQILVLSDCCADRDDEVQRVLTEKIFPRQTTVVTSGEFIQALRKT